MCGILGHISLKINSSFYNALDSIAHRGPDAEGIYELFTDNGYNIQLGHRRLSIIDTTSVSNQPFLSPDNNYVLVYNGEIYNYKSIRDNLIEQGDNFETTGDTEVLFKFLIRYGPEYIDRLKGMFAFAFYDVSKNKLTIGRDHLGIKPVYYYFKDSTLLFSSELKGLFTLNADLRKIDPDQFAEYFLNGFIYEPETGFKDIFKVRPGHFISYEISSKKFVEICYWDVTDNSLPSNSSSNKNFQSTLSETIDNHTIADVPIGLFYSGGVDSSIILTNSSIDLPCITVKSKDDDYKNAGFANDFDYATKICHYLSKELKVVNIDNHITNQNKFLELVDEVAVGNEELISDFTFFSSYMVSRAARDNGFKVMLSGMGADEIFAGYPRYQLLIAKNIFFVFKPFIIFWGKRSEKFRKKIDRFLSFIHQKDFGLSYTSLIGVFSSSEVDSILKFNSGTKRYQEKINKYLLKVSHMSDLKKGMYLDMFGFLSHNFTVADKSSMKASIELRVPLATSEWIDYVWNMSDYSLIDIFRRKKMLMKQLLKDLPYKFVYRRKVGFNAPLDGYINSLGKDRILDMFQADHCFKEYLNIIPVLKIVNEHFSQKKNNTYKIYQLLHFRAWLRFNA